MSHDSPGSPRRASLEVLRAEAQDELATVVVERLRSGEDPWAFMEEIPIVDELVVLILRAELIVADNSASTRPPKSTTGCCARSPSPTPN